MSFDTSDDDDQCDVSVIAPALQLQGFSSLQLSVVQRLGDLQQHRLHQIQWESSKLRNASNLQESIKKKKKKNCFVFLYFRQEVGGGGARRPKAGAHRQGGGADEGGVGDQSGVGREAEQTHLLQTVAGRLHWARSGGNEDMLS